MRQDIRCLIFDVDGTLAETEEAHREAFNLAFASKGLGWLWSRPQYKALLKITGGKERIHAYMNEISFNLPLENDLADFIAGLHAIKTRFYTRMVADQKVALRPGIPQLIANARAVGLRLAIATTTSEANVTALLKSTLGENAVDWFETICCGDMVKVKKPAPDVFLLALKNCGVAAKDAVAIEDSANGVKSAVSAGLRVLVTPSVYTEDDDFSAAHKVFKSATDVAEWIFRTKDIVRDGVTALR